MVGDFTTANGQARRRVAAYSTATGALISTFNPSGPNSQARSVVATNDTVYVGGGFLGLAQRHAAQQPGGLSAPRTARCCPGTRAPPAALTTPPWALAISADGASVFAGGSVPERRRAGGVRPGQDHALGHRRAGHDLAALGPQRRRRTPASAACASRTAFVYGTVLALRPGRQPRGDLQGSDRRHRDSTDVEWVTDCHGDVYSSFLSNGIVYTAGHAHYCGNMGGGFPQYSTWKFQHAQAWTDTQTGDILNEVHGYPNWHGSSLDRRMVNWLPDMAIGSFTGQYQAGWNVTGTSNGDYVAFGGEFPSVNGVGQQGLVRFAKRSRSRPQAEGPRFVATPFVPTLVPTSTDIGAGQLAGRLSTGTTGP